MPDCRHVDTCPNLAPIHNSQLIDNSEPTMSTGSGLTPKRRRIFGFRLQLVTDQCIAMVTGQAGWECLAEEQMYLFLRTTHKTEFLFVSMCVDDDDI